MRIRGAWQVSLLAEQGRGIAPVVLRSRYSRRSLAAAEAGKQARLLWQEHSESSNGRGGQENREEDYVPWVALLLVGRSPELEPARRCDAVGGKEGGESEEEERGDEPKPSPVQLS